MTLGHGEPQGAYLRVHLDRAPIGHRARMALDSLAHSVAIDRLGPGRGPDVLAPERQRIAAELAAQPPDERVIAVDGAPVAFTIISAGAPVDRDGRRGGRLTSTGRLSIRDRRRALQPVSIELYLEGQRENEHTWR